LGVRRPRAREALDAKRWTPPMEHDCTVTSPTYLRSNKSRWCRLRINSHWLWGKSRAALSESSHDSFVQIDRDSIIVITSDLTKVTAQKAGVITNIMIHPTASIGFLDKSRSGLAMPIILIIKNKNFNMDTEKINRSIQQSVSIVDSTGIAA
ncbi:hypothetical protein, partial [Paraburkholderia tropica]|uniref:hypothetical protein n=1 Tax=Paraburkholderia tropica TaxID=92647 RepID=UPI002AB127CE